MVKHIVCFKIKDEYKNDEMMAKIVETLESSKDAIKEVVSVKAGVDFLKSERSYDVALEMVFNSQEEAMIYQKHPHHKNVIQKLMHEVRSASIAVDYEF
ncbi:MAG: Dabb family protein [Bacillota bacterium]